jgi:hypothetical protein
MNLTPRISFHESSLINSRFEGRALLFEIEGVRAEEETRNASIRLEAVETILRDGVQVGSFELECEDPEILTLECTDVSLYLIIECTDFKTHKSQTHSYRIACGSVAVEIH